MNPDWKHILKQLKSYPPAVHKILPPCPKERRKEVEVALGALPPALAEMLNHFNGARLFIRSGPMVAIFGITTIPPLPPLEWAEDWHIDKFTPAWRSFREGKPTDWAIGMTNYGGLIILDRTGTVKEWEFSNGIWGDKTWDFAGWMDETLAEGELFMREE